jgi:hypothetical protein
VSLQWTEDIVVWLPTARLKRRSAYPQVALQDSAAALVVTFDVSGRGQAIHPLDKFDLTRRIAAAVLAQAGVPGAVYSGPTFQKVLLVVR